LEQRESEPAEPWAYGWEYMGDKHITKGRNHAARMAEVLPTEGLSLIPLYTAPPAVPESLTFTALREANAERVQSSKFRECEQHWTHAHWIQATLGELGELANFLKKVDRGDFGLEDCRQDVEKELGDVQGYLDILAMNLGVDLGAATVRKFNEVSERIGSPVMLTAAPQPED